MLRIAMDCSSITDFQQSTAISIAKKFRNLHIGSFTKGFVCLKTYRLSLNAPLPLRQFDKFELFPVWGNLCSYSLSASLNINGNQLLAEKTGNVLQRKCCKIMMRESLPFKNNFDFQFIPRIPAHRYS